MQLLPAPLHLGTPVSTGGAEQRSVSDSHHSLHRLDQEHDCSVIKLRAGGRQEGEYVCLFFQSPHFFFNVVSPMQCSCAKLLVLYSSPQQGIYFSVVQDSDK